MGLYCVKATVPADGGGTKTVRRWGGSMAEVRAHKAELVEKHSIKKTAVQHEEVEAPKGKAGLVEFLNQNAT